MIKINKPIEYLLISLTMCLGVMGTALPSPLYAIYQSDWGLNATEIGYIFTSYMFAVVLTLIVFGKVVKRLGYKNVMQIGVAIGIMALLGSAFSKNIEQLCLSRFFIGVSSGFITMATMEGLKDKFPFEDKEKVDKFSSIIYIIGFALGPIFAGLVALLPTNQLSYPYLALVLIFFPVFLLNFFIYEKKTITTNQLERIKIEFPTKDVKKIFIISSISGLCCFGVFSIYAAFSGSIFKEISLSQSPLITGITVSLILIISAFSQFFSKSINEINSLKIGYLLISLGMFIFCFSLYISNIIVLFFSFSLIGIGHGLCLGPTYYFMGKIVANGNPSLFPTFLLIAYQGTIWPVLICSMLIDNLSFLSSMLITALALTLTAAYIFKLIKEI